MKIVLAIDSFKGSLSTFRAAEAAREGILRVYPYAETSVCPLADGGEGTVEAFIGALGGRLERVKVNDPLGQLIESSYGLIPKTKTAVIEMAKASGLTLIEDSKRNPMFTTTYGVGELIKDAVKKGCRSFIIGIGGSATNDGGVGMLQALGFEFLDKDGKQVPFGALGLKHIVSIKRDRAMKELDECSFLIACDVTNPLCGEYGCSAVFGPQKGATPNDVILMDGWLKNYAVLTKTVNPDSDSNYPGTGAAGGLGFAFLSYLNATLKSGIDLIINETGIEEKIRNCDIVITGEGRLDGQSCMGKAPIGVAKVAKKHGKSVLAFSGCVTDDARECNKYGIDAFFPILRNVCSLEEAMDETNAYKNLADTVEQVFRVKKSFENV